MIGQFQPRSPMVGGGEPEEREAGHAKKEGAWGSEARSMGKGLFDALNCLSPWSLFLFPLFLSSSYLTLPSPSCVSTWI